MNRLYTGMSKPYNPNASAPNSLESIIENTNPNTPVKILEELSIKDFL